MNKRKIIALIVVIVCLLIKLNYRGGGSESIDLNKLRTQAEAEKKTTVEMNTKNSRTELERMYRNGLYLEDYSDVKARLDKEYEKKLEAQFANVTKIPLAVRCDITYFNDTLKTAKAENWSIEKILADPKKNIRESRYIVYYFIVKADSQTLDSMQKITRILNGTPKTTQIGYYIKPEALKIKSPDAWKETTNMPYALGENLKKAGGDAWDGLIQAFTYNQDTQKTCTLLEKKYNENFNYLASTIKVTNGDRTLGALNVCAPIDHPELHFETKIWGDHPDATTNDVYLTVLAQKYMSEEVDAALKEEQMDKHFVEHVIPNTMLPEEVSIVSYDTSSIHTEADKRRFLNLGYKGEYDVSLVYLKQPDEPFISNEKLKTIVQNIQKRITANGVGRFESKIRVGVYITVYNVTTEDQKIVQGLFQRERITENYYRQNVDMSNLYQNMHHFRDETDGYHYLDNFGEKQPFELQATLYDSTQTVEGFMEHNQIIKTNREDE